MGITDLVPGSFLVLISAVGFTHWICFSLHHLPSTPDSAATMASKDYYQQQPPPQGWDQQAYNGQPQYAQGPPQQYSQQPPPPQYNQQPMYTPQDGKGSFDQAFKIEKPKWNDLWAAILVSTSA